MVLLRYVMNMRKLINVLKVLHLSIAGLSIARNAGMRIASAPYIGFVDSDDYVEPAMFEKMLDAMVQSECGNCDICNFLLELMNLNQNESSLPEFWRYCYSRSKECITRYDDGKS